MAPAGRPAASTTAAAWQPECLYELLTLALTILQCMISFKSIPFHMPGNAPFSILPALAPAAPLLPPLSV